MHDINVIHSSWGHEILNKYMCVSIFFLLSIIYINRMFFIYRTEQLPISSNSGINRQYLAVLYIDHIALPLLFI